MANHVKYKHPNECETYINSVVVASSSKETEGKATNSSKQITLEDSFAVKNKYHISDLRARKIHFAIGEMIALDNQPFSVVTDAGFNRLNSE